MKLLGSGGFITPISMLSSEWRKPFNFSIGLHIIVVVIAMLAPTLFDQPRKLPEIYTVNLFTATEVAETAPPAAKGPAAKSAAKPAVRQIKPDAKKPAVSIQPSKPEVSASKPAVIKQISLKPRKMKVKVGKTKEEEALDKAKLSQMVQQMKSQAYEKETKAEADRTAKDAVSKLADALKTTTPGPGPASGSSTKATTGNTSSTTKTTGVTGPKGTGIEPAFYMKQYLSAVYQKIHDHWVLPDLQNWDNALEAVLVITIRKDGVVTDNYFEKKSKNIYFNQFVLKAVKEASPMPPFPGQLEEKTLEIGLRFKPGELY
jgi:colicin import membrane protein